MLLCRTRPLPCKSGKTWAAIFLPCCRYALWPLPFCKNLLCPAIYAQGHHRFAWFRPKLFYWRELQNFLDRVLLIDPRSKAGIGLTKSAGLGVLPVGGRIFLSWFIHIIICSSMVFMSSLRSGFGSFVSRQKNKASAPMSGFERHSHLHIFTPAQSGIASFFAMTLVEWR